MNTFATISGTTLKIKCLYIFIIVLLISFSCAYSSNNPVEFPPSPTPEASRDMITSVSLSDNGEIIAWGAQFSPDGKNLLWTHLVRGKDGNEIVSQEIRMSKFISGKWTKQQILFQVPVNKQIWVFAVSNNGVALSNIDNDLIFYPSLNCGNKPIHMEIKVDPVIIYRHFKPIQQNPEN